tara:strand:- start:1259 stop:1540 length:282 start_codon:yes stop_codon:yes gene_type:complete
MPKSHNRKGGFVKKNSTERKQLLVNDLTGRTAPEGQYRVISIARVGFSYNQEVWIEGTFTSFPEAKKIADDKAVDGVVCYIHGSGPRVLYRAR